MVDDTALGIETARARTRISALVVGAGLRRRAFRVGNALRPTFRRNPLEARHTRAHREATDFTAQAVGSAWCWCTRFLLHNRSSRNGYKMSNGFSRNQTTIVLNGDTTK